MDPKTKARHRRILLEQVWGAVFCGVLSAGLWVLGSYGFLFWILLPMSAIATVGYLVNTVRWFLGHYVEAAQQP